MNRYLEIRSQIKDGDCFVEVGTSAISKTIVALGGKWANAPSYPNTGLSHAYMAILLSKDMVDNYFTIEALASGLSLMRLSSEVNSTIQSGGHIWWLPLKDEFQNVRFKLASWLLQHVGTGYDYKGLFLYNFLPPNTMDEKRMFCSAIPYWSALDIGIIKKVDKPWRPVDVPNSAIYKPAILVG